MPCSDNRGLLHSYYSWSVAAPMIACRAIYGCDLPKDVLGDLVGQHQKKTAVSGWRGWWSRSSTTPAAATAPVPAPLPISASSPKVMDKIAESPPMSPPVSAPPSPSSVASTRGPKEETPEEHNYAKTLRLTSDQLVSLFSRLLMAHGIVTANRISAISELAKGNEFGFICCSIFPSRHRDYKRAYFPSGPRHQNCHFGRRRNHYEIGRPWPPVYHGRP